MKILKSIATGVALTLAAVGFTLGAALVPLLVDVPPVVRAVVLLPTALSAAFVVLLAVHTVVARRRWRRGGHAPTAGIEIVTGRPAPVPAAAEGGEDFWEYVWEQFPFWNVTRRLRPSPRPRTPRRLLSRGSLPRTDGGQL